MSGKKYRFDGREGCVERGRTEHGVLVGLYRSDQAGFSTEEGPWTMGCETHGSTANLKRRTCLSYDLYYNSGDWCEKCHELRSGKPSRLAIQIARAVTALTGPAYFGHEQVARTVDDVLERDRQLRDDAEWRYRYDGIADQSQELEVRDYEQSYKTLRKNVGDTEAERWAASLGFETGYGFRSGWNLAGVSFRWGRYNGRVAEFAIHNGDFHVWTHRRADPDALMRMLDAEQ